MSKVQVNPGQLSFDPLHWADSGYSMEEAMDDLNVWLQTMLAAMPVTEIGKGG